MIKVTLDALAWKDVEPDVQALVDKWLVAAGDMVSAGQVLANVISEDVGVSQMRPYLFHFLQTQHVCR